MLTYCSCGCAWNPDWFTDCPKCDPIGIAQQEDQWEAQKRGACSFCCGSGKMLSGFSCRRCGGTGKPR